MKEITITIPDNCEFQKNGNTYTVVEKEKKLTYDDIAEKLFSKQCFFIGISGNIVDTNPYGNSIYHSNNCTSKKQAEKLLAINKLMNVAKYLNGDWQPDWNNTKEFKYYIYYSSGYNVLYIDAKSSIQDNIIYFKSEELAQKAIEILGEETIKLALCTDY